MKRSVIITGGGIGKRMGAELPKQFLLLNGLPIIIHTIKKFLAFDPQIELIIVLPESQIDFWKTMCRDHGFQDDHKCVTGGKERFFSVKKGLAEVSGDIIAVHDAVRPLVSYETIEKCFSEAEKHGGAVPVIPINESIRRIVDGESSPRNRDDFRIVQTPQCFTKDILNRAYAQEYNPKFTDDASVVESNGEKIELVDGNQENIKITRAPDIKIAECLMH